MQLNGTEKMEVRILLRVPYVKNDALDQQLDVLNNDQVQMVRETLTEWAGERYSAGRIDAELKVSAAEKQAQLARRIATIINYPYIPAVHTGVASLNIGRA